MIPTSQTYTPYNPYIFNTPNIVDLLLTVFEKQTNEP